MAVSIRSTPPNRNTGGVNAADAGSANAVSRTATAPRGIKPEARRWGNFMFISSPLIEELRTLPTTLPRATRG